MPMLGDHTHAGTYSRGETQGADLEEGRLAGHLAMEESRCDFSMFASHSAPHEGFASSAHRNCGIPGNRTPPCAFRQGWQPLLPSPRTTQGSSMPRWLSKSLAVGAINRRGTEDMTSKKKVPVVLRWNADSEEWIAQTTSAPRLTAQGPTPRNARTAIGHELARHFTGDVDFEAALELPPQLKKKLEALREKTEALRELTEEIPALRLEIARELLREYRVSQVEAAELVGLTHGYLNKVLWQPSGGSAKPRTTTRKRRA
jgi:hypothetical protein